MRKLRKLIRVISWICIISVVLSVYANAVDTVKSQFSLSSLSGKEYYLTAHRGLSAIAPENTAASLEQAGKAGYYAAEFDIIPTKDGIWVLMHDDTVDRMTDGTGEVSSFTYEEIRQLKIDSGNGIDKFLDERIITLETAIGICKRYSMRPMVEVKGGTPEDMQRVINSLSRAGADDAIIIDFDAERLEAVRKLDGDVELWYLDSEIDESTIEFAEKNNTGIAFKYKTVSNYKYIKTAREKGITLAAWTVDYLPFMDILMLFGVKYITTNRILP